MINGARSLLWRYYYWQAVLAVGHTGFDWEDLYTLRVREYIRSPLHTSPWVHRSGLDQ